MASNPPTDRRALSRLCPGTWFGTSRKRTPLAWLNLRHQKMRSLVAVAGVAFALVLIFTQLGFLGAVRATATLLYDKLDFDIVLVSREYVDINHMSTFSLRRLTQAQQLDNVAQAVPLYVGFQLWRNPLDQLGDPDARRRRNIMLIGFRLSDQVFSGLPEVDNSRDALLTPDTVLIDRRSRREFGPQEPGTVTELGARPIEIVGQFTLGTGFGADGMVVVSDETYSRILGGRSLGFVSLGLIKVKPGARPEAVAAELNRNLPEDVRARTRADLAAREQRFWVQSTAVGIIFFLGVLVALIVGVVFVYQVMSSDIEDHLRQYATLKAIGFGGGYLARVVLQQAILLAVGGYLLGIALAWGLYELAAGAIAIPIGMTLGRAVVVLILALAMCSLSGLLALQKVRAADPADLF